MMEKQIRPFSNGTEYMFWRETNCDRCKKNVLNENDNYKSQCDIEEALSLGAITGTIPESIFKRMGNPLDFNCPEFEKESEE